MIYIFNRIWNLKWWWPFWCNISTIWFICFNLFMTSDKFMLWKSYVDGLWDTYYLLVENLVYVDNFVVEDLSLPIRTQCTLYTVRYTIHGIDCTIFPIVVYTTHKIAQFGVEMSKFRPPSPQYHRLQNVLPETHLYIYIYIFT